MQRFHLRKKFLKNCFAFFKKNYPYSTFLPFFFLPSNNFEEWNIVGMVSSRNFVLPRLFRGRQTNEQLAIEIG